MNTVIPVKFTTADGLEIILRATLGARRRIADRFGMGDVSAIFTKFGDGSLPEIAYCMAFTNKGEAPAFGLAELAESMAPSEASALLSHILSAFSQGKLSPNDAAEILETLLGGGLETLTSLPTSTGSSSLDSLASASD
jgi:hypothetical protein